MTLTFCRHVYEESEDDICQLCGKDTHRTDWDQQTLLFKKYYESGESAKYKCPKDGGTIRGWWSI